MKALRFKRVTRRLARALRKERKRQSILQARWDALLKDIQAAVLLLDSRGRITSASDNACELLQYRPDALIGANAGSLAPREPAEHPLAPGVLQDAVVPHVRFTTPTTILCGDGSEREILLTVRKLPEGDNTLYLVQMQSAGEHAASVNFAQNQALLEAERRSRDEILATIWHELRTPLHGLIATLDTLQDKCLSKGGSQQLAVARASARTMLELANDMLDIARISDYGSLPLKCAPFNLEGLLREAVEQYNARATAKGLSLWLLLTGDSPSFFLGDRLRVKQIVTNLLTNAIKFTQSGPIIVQAIYGESGIQIDVHDSGPGIPKHEQEAVFQPFVQGARQDGSGTGLGLPISRRLCEAMGGRLDLISSSDKGSTFRVILPLPRSDESPEQEVSVARAANPPGHILVVDDHPINRSVVKAMLDTLGCSSTLAGSGEEALQLIEEQDFDLILMDCRMPGLDGFATARRARQLLARRIPIVAMTADVQADKRGKGHEAVMDDYLIKPFGKTDLQELLCTWLRTDRRTDPSRTLAAEPVIDEAVFAQLRESVGWQVEPLRNVAQSFRITVASCLASIDSGDSDEVRRGLHTVAGTGGMIGAMQVRRLATELKSAWRSQDVRRINELKSALAGAAERFEREFLERLATDD